MKLKLFAKGVSNGFEGKSIGKEIRKLDNQASTYLMMGWFFGKNLRENHERKLGQLMLEEPIKEEKNGLH